MKIKIEFDTSNASFQDDFSNEITSVLNQATLLIHKVKNSHDEFFEFGSKPLKDINGNTVGTIEIEDIKP